jgi:small-conductance mechanosensitive channel
LSAPVPFDNLLTRLAAESGDAVLMWQGVVLGVAALAAWAAMRLATPFLQRPQGSWPAGRAGIRRIGYPLILLLGVLVGRAIAENWLAGTHLLNLAVPLLLSLASVRLMIHALRYVFEPHASLRLWERSAAWLIWSVFALHVTGLLPRIHAALEALSFQSGSYRFSLLLLFQAATAIIVAVIVALMLARLVERRLMDITRMNLSLRMALSKATRTIFLILAVLVALPTVGIDLTMLSVFGGALGVGIGFGLQKVASNYVSGFIILLDRSVRIGDMVTVDNKQGEVSQINTRYTLLHSLDGTATIVPNEMLITQSVINHSLTRPNLRIALPARVAYGTDLERAEALMQEAARSQDRVVLDEPDRRPRVYLKEFADNGIVLELVVWFDKPDAGQASLRSNLNWAIWRRFRAAGIEIPGPRPAPPPAVPAST